MKASEMYMVVMVDQKGKNVECHGVALGSVLNRYFPDSYHNYDCPNWSFVLQPASMSEIKKGKFLHAIPCAGKPFEYDDFAKKIVPPTSKPGKLFLYHWHDRGTAIMVSRSKDEVGTFVDQMSEDMDHAVGLECENCHMFEIDDPDKPLYLCGPEAKDVVVVSEHHTIWVTATKPDNETEPLEFDEIRYE